MSLPVLKSYDGMDEEDAQTGVLSTTTIGSHVADNDDIRSLDHHLVDQLKNSFSMDLETQCIRHFCFLKFQHETGITQRAVTPKSLQRYVMWLQMIVQLEMQEEAGNSSSSEILALLVPPSDVAWLWHCHRLAPITYKECIQNYRRSSTTSESAAAASSNSSFRDDDWRNHHPAGDPYALESNEISRQTWAQHYPNEPFDLDDAGSATNASSATTTTIIMEEGSSMLDMLQGFDVLSSARAQAEFYWQIQPLFHRRNGDNRMVNYDVAITNYHRFLELFRLHPHLEFKLVPTYEIDLLWHTHITGGAIHKYWSDCEQISGKVIHHDDSYGDGDRTGILQVSFERTAELWNLAYNDNTYRARGGYRGPPDASYYQTRNSVPGSRRGTAARNHGTIDGITSSLPKKEETRFQAVWKIMFPDSTPYRISLFMLLVGLLIVLFGLALIHPSRYVCGSQPPSPQEIQARGAPVCLTTSTQPGALCLEAGLDPNEPSIWCQENLAKSSSSQSYYLWWWTSDEGSWRMSKDFKTWNDPMAYIAREPKQPQPHQAPLKSTWLLYNISDYQWSAVDNEIIISECNLEDGMNEDGIPNACFAPKQIPLVWVIGAGLAIFSALTCFVILAARGQSDEDRLEIPGRRRRAHYGGGVCGGGGCGGGCGGG